MWPVVVQSPCIGRPPVIPTNISQRTDPAVALPLFITPSSTQPTISQPSRLQHPAQPLSQPVAHNNLRFQPSRELALTCSLLSFPLKFYSSNKGSDLCFYDDAPRRTKRREDDNQLSSEGAG